LGTAAVPHRAFHIIRAAESLKGMESWKGRTAAEIAEAPPVLAEIRKPWRASTNSSPV